MYGDDDATGPGDVLELVANELAKIKYATVPGKRESRNKKSFVLDSPSVEAVTGGRTPRQQTFRKVRKFCLAQLQRYRAIPLLRGTLLKLPQSSQLEEFKQAA